MEERSPEGSIARSDVLGNAGEGCSVPWQSIETGPVQRGTPNKQDIHTHLLNFLLHCPISSPEPSSIGEEISKMNESKVCFSQRLPTLYARVVIHRVDA